MEDLYKRLASLPNTLENRQKLVSIAADIAESALHLFEEVYHDDERPRKAIEAAREWVKNPCAETAMAAQVAGHHVYECVCETIDAIKAGDAAVFASDAAEWAADAAYSLVHTTSGIDIVGHVIDALNSAEKANLIKQEEIIKKYLGE